MLLLDEEVSELVESVVDEDDEEESELDDYPTKIRSDSLQLGL